MGDPSEEAQEAPAAPAPADSLAALANGNCGTSNPPGNDAPDLSGATISFTPAGNLQVTGTACDNDSDLAAASIDNGAGFVANCLIDDTGHFTSGGPGTGQLSYDEPVFVPAGSQITVTVTVVDTDGAVGTKSATLTVPVPNVNPELDYSKAVRNGYIVDIQGQALDPDGDVVKVSVAWGDGTVDEHTQRLPGYGPGWVELDGVHNYDPIEVAGKDYFVIITLTDDRGGTTSVSHEVSF
ncbi:MAG: hypothetical protein ACE5GB_06470 [Acidimicrobiales bacterium]